MPDPSGLGDKPDSGRLFFALWPDAPTRQRLDRAAASLHQLRGGRRTRAATIHLTLVFLGDVPRAAFADLIATAARIGSEGFTLNLDQADCWRHNRVAFLTDHDPPPALFELVEQLEAALATAGFSFDRRPYKPHVTLLRNANCGQKNPALEPVVWAAREFTLVQSVPARGGVSYPVLARFPLR